MHSTVWRNTLVIRATSYPYVSNRSSGWLPPTTEYTKVDERILGFNIMKDRKVITSGRIVVSADGKSHTVTMSGTDAKGHRVSSNEVYEKQ
jgi:hypothetical protein